MLIQRDGSLTTGTALSPNNVWAGSAFEYLRGPSYVSIGIITPGTAGGLLSTCTIGGMTVAEQYLVPFRAPTVDGPSNPQIPGDFNVQGAGNGMDRLVSTLDNPTGGTLAYSAAAIITPAGGRRR